jgi:hypothetical protein
VCETTSAKAIIAVATMTIIAISRVMPNPTSGSNIFGFENFSSLMLLLFYRLLFILAVATNLFSLILHVVADL